jgi:hypothetical protein
MIKGRLGYNHENDRYGILMMDLWEHDGLHCGETFEINLDDKWVADRIEYDGEWYLVYSGLRGDDLEYLRVRYK